MADERDESAAGNSPGAERELEEGAEEREGFGVNARTKVAVERARDAARDAQAGRPVDVDDVVN